MACKRSGVQIPLAPPEKALVRAEPKTTRGRWRIGLHPLLVAALTRHREELELLGLYDDEGFVFCTRNATPISLSSLRRGFKASCEQAGLGREWTTYELRRSFVSLVADQLDDSSRSPTSPAT
jgi:hypothetical protein